MPSPIDMNDKEQLLALATCMSIRQIVKELSRRRESSYPKKTYPATRGASQGGRQERTSFFFCRNATTYRHNDTQRLIDTATSMSTKKIRERFTGKHNKSTLKRLVKLHWQQAGEDDTWCDVKQETCTSSKVERLTGKRPIKRLPLIKQRNEKPSPRH